MSTEELNLIEESCSVFEKHLTKFYLHNSSNNPYYNYLIDIKNMNLNPMFYIDIKESKKILKKIKKSSLFDKIFTNEYYLQNFNEEGITINGDNYSLNYPTDLYYVNFKGELLNCIRKNEDNSFLSGYTEIMVNEADLDPITRSRMILSTIPMKDFNKSSVKMIITFQFYYELLLILEKNENQK
ncbi:MAG: hypothetical protein ACLGGV_02980 [Bacteroidia bacterium]